MTIRFLTNDKTSKQIAVVNAYGQIVLTKNLETGIENTELRVGDLAKGVYWVTVKTPNMAVPFRKANKFVKW